MRALGASLLLLERATRISRHTHNAQRAPQAQMRAPFLLLLQAALTLGDFQVDLLITREVRGAVWPLNKYNSPCSTDNVNATPCNCFGGASRRQAVFSNAPEHVSIDTGSYFSGSGCARPPLPITQRPAPNWAMVANHPTTAWTGCTSLSSAATSAPSTLPRPGTKRGHSHTETLPQAPRLLSRRVARFWPGAPPRLRPPS